MGYLRGTKGSSNTTTVITKRPKTVKEEIRALKRKVNLYKNAPTTTVSDPLSILEAHRLGPNSIWILLAISLLQVLIMTTSLVMNILTILCKLKLM